MSLSSDEEPEESHQFGAVWHSHNTREEDEAEERDLQARQEWHQNATRHFCEREKVISQSGLRIKKIESLLDIPTRLSPDRPENVFQHNRPKALGSVPGMGFDKGYVYQHLYGGYDKVWKYCVGVDAYQPVLIEEMVPENRPVRLYFDVELKRGKQILDVIQRARLESQYLHLFEMQVEACKTTFASIRLNPPSCEKLTTLVRHFVQLNQEPFTNEECSKGLISVLRHVRGTLKRLIGADLKSQTDAPWEAMNVCSACRPDKFSLHIVMGDIYCDRATLTMPLVVHEIARSWQMKCIYLLLTCREEEWGSESGRFYMRNLNMGGLLNDRMRFKAYNDTAFDEGVYSKRHFLRMPGANKVLNGHTLRPMDIPSDMSLIDPTALDMMGGYQRFRTLFPDTEEGLRKWLAHTIDGGSRFVQTQFRNLYLFSDWTPPPAYVKKRTWRRMRDEVASSSTPHVPNALTQSFTMVGCNGKPLYREHRRTVIAPPDEEERLSMVDVRNIDYGSSPQTFDSDNYQLRVQETGRLTPFNEIPHNAQVCCRHDGVNEESNASAVVYRRGNRCGYYCFTCSMHYVPAQETPHEVEERYPFQETEIRHAIAKTKDPEDGVYPYIADPDGKNSIRWTEMMKRKYIVIDALMGSGKTEELNKLVRMLRRPEATKKRTILFVTFRIALAVQMSNRLKCSCYKVVEGGEQTQRELDEEIRNNQHPFLVICVNSIHKLGDLKYHIVVFDECSLIRMHLVSRVTTQALPVIWPKLIDIIRKADNVILLQEYVSERDVELYTSIDDVDPTDRDQVSAFWFKKPCVIHPIEWTTDQEAAIARVVRSYAGSFNDDGVCVAPRAILVSRVSQAIFIIHCLEEQCKHIFKDREDVYQRNVKRIKGLWRALRITDHFANKFLNSPNDAAPEADVVVCTAIIGAGFSVNTHFVAFHAFLDFTLDHWVQRQFLQRFRYLMMTMDIEAVRQSYIWVQPGMGENEQKVPENMVDNIITEFNKIRVDIISKAYLNSDAITRDAANVHLLAVAHATQATKEILTQSSNADLMLKYGTEDIDSEFKPFELEISQFEKDIIKRTMMSQTKQMKHSIGQEVSGLMEFDDELDFGTSMMSINDYSMREIIIAAQSTLRKGDWEKCVHSPSVAKCILLIKHNTEDDTNESIVKEMASPNKEWGRSIKLACWLCYIYRTLGDREEGSLVMNDFFKRRYNTSLLRMASALIIAASVLPELLGGRVECSAIHVIGETPFYNTCVVMKKHRGLCDYFKSRMKSSQDDTPETTDRKMRERQYAGKAITRGQTCALQNVGEIYTDPAKAFSYLKDLCSQAGLTLTASRKRVTPVGDDTSYSAFSIRVEPSDIAQMLILKHDFVARVRAMLPELMHTTNLCDFDKEIFCQGVNIFNNALARALELQTDQDSPGKGITRMKYDSLKIRTTKPVDGDDAQVTSVIQLRIDEDELIRGRKLRENERLNALAAATAASETVARRSGGAGGDDGSEEENTFNGGDVTGRSRNELPAQGRLVTQSQSASQSQLQSRSNPALLTIAASNLNLDTDSVSTCLTGFATVIHSNETSQRQPSTTAEGPRRKRMRLGPRQGEKQP